MFKEFKNGYEDPDDDPSTAQNLDTATRGPKMVSKQLSNNLQMDGGSIAH
jgi:hypothetical protein